MSCSGCWTHSLTCELPKYSFTFSMHDHSGHIFWVCLCEELFWIPSSANDIMLSLGCCQLFRVCMIQMGKIKHSAVYIGIRKEVSKLLTSDKVLSW